MSARKSARPLTVGLTGGLLNDQGAEVRIGLNEGDLVVTAPQGNLEAGQSVCPLL
jgi:hypothetical protein